jgi:16S rRNA G527 N7-methylase RsmG
VPDNVFFAKKLSQELGFHNIKFIESDIMDFREKHSEKYDIVFATLIVPCPQINK